MWPFKRKEDKKARQIVKTVLCIPGFWKDSIEIIEKTNGKFMVVGDFLIDIVNKRQYSFQLFDRDDNLKKSFTLAGKVTLVSEDFINEIDKHSSVVYISCETGSFYNAWFLAMVGAVLLQSGGIGIKVESTGKAFEKMRWLELLEDGSELSMYELFVIGSIMMTDGTTFSCGMQTIGFKEAIISDEKFEDAIRIIKVFNHYQVIEKPVILYNQTFQTEKNSPFYRIKEEWNQPYKTDELFNNPFGMWRLIRE